MLTCDVSTKDVLLVIGRPYGMTDMAVAED